MSHPDISIILLVKDAQDSLVLSLPIIFSQQTNLSYEVMVIDNESADSTREILRDYPVRIIDVPRNNFHHSRTRMLGVENALGRYIVFLSGDAIPCNKLWLEYLVKPLEDDDKAAGSYSRQVPRAGCLPPEARDIYCGAGPLRIIKAVDFSDTSQVANYKENIWQFIAFSDVSSCYRKALLRRYPFEEKIPAVEDQEWCKRMLDKSYVFYYQPESCVVHSHNLSLGNLYRREYTFGKSFGYFVDAKNQRRIGYVLIGALGAAIQDYFFLLYYPLPFYRKIVWILKIPLYRLIKYYAFYKGFINQDASNL